MELVQIVLGPVSEWTDVLADGQGMTVADALLNAMDNLPVRVAEDYKLALVRELERRAI